MILEVFSKLNNSRILWFSCSEEIVLSDQPVTQPLRVLSLEYQGLWPWGFLIEGFICFLFLIMSSGTSTYYINNSAGLSSDAYTRVLLLVHYLSQDRALCIQGTPSHTVEGPVAQTCLWGHSHPPWWDVSHACPVAPLSQKGSQGHRRQSPACDSRYSARLVTCWMTAILLKPFPLTGRLEETPTVWASCPSPSPQCSVITLEKFQVTPTSIKKNKGFFFICFSVSMFFQCSGNIVLPGVCKNKFRVFI